MTKTIVFIDGANLYVTAKNLDFDIDYKKLKDHFFKEFGLTTTFRYYTAIQEDQEFVSLRPLVDWLSYNGFTVITKPAKTFEDQNGRRKTKANMDTEICVDMLELAPHYDHVVLFSGDGDFKKLVEAVQRKGRLVSVYSTIETDPPMAADELRRQADVFVDLDELADQISRSEKDKKPRVVTG